MTIKNLLKILRLVKTLLMNLMDLHKKLMIGEK